MVLPPSWKGEVQETIEEATNSAAERQKSQNNKQVAEIAAEIKSLNEAYQAQSNKPERKDKAKRALDIATVVLLFATAFFTGLAWWVFRGQLHVFQEQLRLDQRAWLGINVIAPIPLIPEVGKTLQIRITIKNTGKTPARHVIGNAVADPVSKGEQPNFSYIGDKNFKQGLLSPNAEGGLTLSPVQSRSTGEIRPLTQEIVDQISRGDIVIYTHGRIDYEDIFRTGHWFTFCAFLIIPFQERFGACPDHNDTDDYQTATK